MDIDTINIRFNFQVPSEYQFSSENLPRTFCLASRVFQGPGVLWTNGKPMLPETLLDFLVCSHREDLRTMVTEHF